MGLFQKKVELHVPRGDGTTRRIKIPERTWNEWVKEGKVRPADAGEGVGKSRPPLSEAQAAAHAVQIAQDHADHAWPRLMANYQARLDRPLGIRDEGRARLDFSLAVIALELEAVPNLFPREQTPRLTAWTLQSCQASFGPGAPDELAEYHGAFRSALEHPEGDMPHDAIWWRLLERWLGPALNAHELVIDGRRSGFLNPLLPAVISEIVLAPPFLGTWKAISETYTLVEGA